MPNVATDDIQRLTREIATVQTWQFVAKTESEADRTYSVSIDGDQLPLIVGSWGEAIALRDRLNEALRPVLEAEVNKRRENIKRLLGV
jgi:hypothetical protein